MQWWLRKRQKAGSLEGLDVPLKALLQPQTNTETKEVDISLALCVLTQATMISLTTKDVVQAYTQHIVQT